MGILQLNMYINKHCSDCISTQPLSVLKKKKIVIDVQIYLYTFLCAANGSLMENMYKMCLLFRMNEMVPIFVFDNRSGPNKSVTNNKTDMRKQRKENRNQAFQEIRNDALNLDKVISDAKLQTLKRQIVRVTDAQIAKIKQLIVSFGFTCLDAEEEADEICAHISLTTKACGCFSDDTDMLAYGCANVYRNLNLEDKTVCWINVTSVLKKLDMSQDEFRQVCALAPNDYNCGQKNNPTIHHVMEQFRLYKNDSSWNNTGFYKGFMENNPQYAPSNQEFQRIYNIFDVFARPTLFPKISFSNKNMNYKQLQNIMESDGFHYVGSNNFG
jgi:hypothetical protein